MVSKNNLRRRLASDAKRIPHYSLRKLSVGIASVLLGTTLYFGGGMIVHADTVTSQPTVSVTNTSVNTNTSTQTLSTAQQINVNSGFINHYQDSYSEAGSLQYAPEISANFDQNTYQSDPVAAQEQVNVTHLTQEQLQEINTYQLQLINQLRERLGLPDYVQYQSDITTAQQEADEQGARKLWGHNAQYLNGSGENVGAWNVADNGYSMASWKPTTISFERNSQSHTVQTLFPLGKIATMDDLRASVFYMTTAMLFEDDGAEANGHMHNFLRQDSGENTEVALGIEAFKDNNSNYTHVLLRFIIFNHRLAQSGEKPLNGRLNSTNANYDYADRGNYGNVDSAYYVSNRLHVTGWSASNNNRGYQKHFLIAFDYTTNRELGRVQVIQPVYRPDVQRVYNIYNASQSGYDETISINFANMRHGDDSIGIISRYTNSVDGNSDYVDNWSRPIALDLRNLGWVDDFNVRNGHLQVCGWHATNLAINRPYHFILLFDQTAGHEVGQRVLLNSLISRPDIKKAYPDIVNGDQSGFAADFAIANLDPTHEYQIISRYSSDRSGNSDYVDMWFKPTRVAPANLSSLGWVDRLDLSNPDEVVVDGWHAANTSNMQCNRFMILFDDTAQRQVASVKVSSVARPDIKKAYPDIINGEQSGFHAVLKLDAAAKRLINYDHTYSIVSRYSADPDDNGSNGQHTDWWSAPIRLNQDDHFAIDHFQASGRRVNVRGWMISDRSATQPHAYVFLMSNGREVARQAVTLTTREDVGRVYPEIYGSAKSGFDVTFNLTSAQVSQLNGSVQVMLRFSQAADGNSVNGQGTSDQYSRVYSTQNISDFSYVKFDH